MVQVRRDLSARERLEEFPLDSGRKLSAKDGSVYSDLEIDPEANIQKGYFPIFDNVLDPLSKQYKLDGYPENIGLYENGILFRKNNDNVNKFNQLWFDETAKWNTEDQISMMYSLWKNPGVKVNGINHTFVAHNYMNKHLTLTDQFGTEPRAVTYVKK